MPSDLASVLQLPSCGTDLSFPAHNIPIVSEQNSVEAPAPSLAPNTSLEVCADAPPSMCPGTNPNPDLSGSGEGGQNGVASFCYGFLHEGPMADEPHAETGAALTPNEKFSGMVPPSTHASPTPPPPPEIPHLGVEGSNSRV